MQQHIIHYFQWKEDGMVIVCFRGMCVSAVSYPRAQDRISITIMHASLKLTFFSNGIQQSWWS